MRCRRRSFHIPSVRRYTGAMTYAVPQIGVVVLTLLGAISPPPLAAPPAAAPAAAPEAERPTAARSDGNTPPPPVYGETSTDAATVPASLRLVHSTEVRHRFEPGVTLENAPHFRSGGPPTGKWLMCDLLIDGMPQTSRVMRVTVLSEAASDDLGNDLIKSIQTKVDNDPIVRLNRDIVVEPRGPAIGWTIAAPARSASTFDAALHVRATVSARRDDVKIRPTREWQPLKHPSTDHLKVEYRWQSRGGDNTYLEMRPPAVEEYIYFLAPQPHARRSGRPHFSATDSTSGDFTLESGTPEGAEIHLQLHADIKTIEAVLTLDNHPLP